MILNSVEECNWKYDKRNQKWWWFQIRLIKCFKPIKQRVTKRLWAWNLMGKELESVTGKQARWWCHTKAIAR